MTGTLRLFLAATVVAFHAGMTFGGIRPGISAVIAFFLISGYAMSGLGRRYFATPGTVLPFYADRALRLLPLYYVWLTITGVVVLGLGRHGVFQAGPVGWVNVVANLTIVPLGCFTLIPGVARMIIILPAWSLGLEITFYALVPLMLRARAFVWLLAAVGLGVFLLATNRVIQGELYTYWLFPGTLPWFLLGWALERRDRALGWTLGAVLVLDFLWNAYLMRLGPGLHRELAVGGGFGFLLLFAASRVKSGGLDRLIGEAAYGTYLAQIAVLLLVPVSFGPFWHRAPLVVLLSVGCGFLGWYAIERPINRYRRRARQHLPEAGRKPAAYA